MGIPLSSGSTSANASARDCQGLNQGPSGERDQCKCVDGQRPADAKTANDPCAQQHPRRDIEPEKTV